MTKAELIETVARATRLEKKTAARVVGAAVSSRFSHTSSLTMLRSSRMYIGRPAPLGNVMPESMPIA